MRKQAALVALLMLGFAGAGSSAIVTRALAQSKPKPHAARLEKGLGPRPTPRWYWRWAQWQLGEGYAKGHQRERALRPKQMPHRVPAWAWRRLHLFVLARTQRQLAGRGGHGGGKGHGRTTTTGTTSDTSTTTETTTTATTSTTTTDATTTGTTTTTPSGGETYGQAISYTQTRPAFTPTREIDVADAASFQNALANLRPGDLVKATGSFTVSGETKISARLSSPAVIDLSAYTVKFVYSGGDNTPAVWLDNASNIRIYGGDVSTADTGGGCIFSTGSQDDLWWGFVAHDCGGSGLVLIPNTQPITGLDLQGEITHAGMNLAWDPHAEKGTGLHGAYLGNGAYSFANNRIALYVHDQPSGAAIQYGSGSGKVAGVNNVLYLRAVNLTEVAETQTGGNGIQFWGIDGQSADVKYIEVDNAQGYGLFDGGMYSGTTLSGVKVEYGRASDTNQNSRYAGQDPWRTNKGTVYGDVSPTP